MNGDAGDAATGRRAPATARDARRPASRRGPPPSPRSTSPVSSGRSGRPPTCSFALAKPLTGTSDVRQAGQAGQRQLVEHDVEIEILVRERDLAADVDGAARLAFQVQRLHRRRLFRCPPCRSCPCSAAPRPARANRRHPCTVTGVPAGTVTRAVTASSGPLASACSDSRPARSGLCASVARSMSRRSSFEVDDRRAQRLARALLPQLHGAAAVDVAAEHRPRQLVEAQRAALEAELGDQLGELAPARADALDAGVAGDARIFEAAVRLGVDARALGDAAAGPSRRAAGRDRRRPRPARRRSSGVRGSPTPSRSRSRP